jgi:hypothetical protein
MEAFIILHIITAGAAAASGLDSTVQQVMFEEG